MVCSKCEEWTYTCIPGPGTACLGCKRRKVRCDRSARSAGVGGPAQAPRVGGRKRGREDSLDADGRSGGSKRRRRNLEGYRAAVEAEKAAALSTPIVVVLLSLLHCLGPFSLRIFHVLPSLRIIETANLDLTSVGTFLYHRTRTYLINTNDNTNNLWHTNVNLFEFSTLW
jgi:hypothetical protein